MRSLYLSTLKAKDANVGMLLQYLSSEVAKATTTPTAASAPHQAAVDVFLQVHDAHRSTFLEHAESLYAAVLSSSSIISVLGVSIIPVVQAAGDARESAGSGCARPVCFDKASMLASAGGAGFTPCYKYVAVGGTFDHLHEGHKLLLTTALLYATDKLRVGVTGPQLLVNKKFAAELQPIEVRTGAVLEFLRKIRQDIKLDVAEISDVCGGTDTMAEIEALVVSPETEKSLPVINEMRWKNGQLRPLAPVHVPHVRAPDGAVLSSTQLREKLLLRHNQRKMSDMQ